MSYVDFPTRETVLMRDLLLFLHENIALRHSSNKNKDFT